MALHWLECHPGFSIPRALDCARFAAYDDFDLEAPALTDIVNIHGYGRPPSWAWGAWFKAQREDAPLKMDPGLADALALRIYDSKRFAHNIPAWRQQLIRWLTEIDDIEDQVSTIAWLAETVLAKVIPLPRSLLSFSHGLKKTLDAAENVLTLGTTSRRSKSEWASKRAEVRASKRAARSKLAVLVQWMRENWGNLLEAGQASNTWFDVGIVLGPIMGFIEDGIWTAGAKTLDNYLIAADAILPGYREVYWEHLTAYGEAVDDRWAELYEGAVLITTDTIEQLNSGDLGFGDVPPTYEIEF